MSKLSRRLPSLSDSSPKSYEPSLCFSITHRSRFRYPAIGLHIDRIDPSASKNYTHTLARKQQYKRKDEVRSMHLIVKSIQTRKRISECLGTKEGLFSACRSRQGSLLSTCRTIFEQLIIARWIKIGSEARRCLPSCFVWKPFQELSSDDGRCRIRLII